MSTTPKIIGICLVKNEDRFLDRALRNVAEFCDTMLVVDHLSSDGTAEIARAWQAADSRFSYHRIRTPPESQTLIEPYIGTPTWIFAVDGDEIYDPAGLRRLRPELLAGRFDSFPRIFGNVLHCDELDETRRVVSGFLSPPSRSMTKLYNFGVLREWRGPCSERLHGGTPVYRPEFAEAADFRFHDQVAWDDSPFRCLHMVFLRRSSRQTEGGARPNIAEQYAYTPWQRVMDAVRRLAGRPAVSTYKNAKYRRGARVTVDAAAFFPDGHAGISAGIGGFL